MNEDWCRRLIKVVGGLPIVDLRAIADALDRGLLAIYRNSSGSSRVRSACELVEKAVQATSPDFTQGVLQAALQQRLARRVSVDPVWSGPQSAVTTSRLTASAVVELVGQAESEILLAAFAMYSPANLQDALVAATQRGVDITLIRERTVDNPGFHGPDTTFPNVVARRLHWPAEHRQAGAAMHSKYLVVDRTVALVGSANITNSALSYNMECGVLVRGGGLARQIALHIDGLVDTGQLRVTS